MVTLPLSSVMLDRVGGVTSEEVIPIVVSSTMAGVVTMTLPMISFRTAVAWIWSCRVPTEFGVTCTVNTAGETWLTVPMVTSEVPALPKAAAVTVLASMGSLKVSV